MLFLNLLIPFNIMILGILLLSNIFNIKELWGVFLSILFTSSIIIGFWLIQNLIESSTGGHFFSYEFSRTYSMLFEISNTIFAFTMVFCLPIFYFLKRFNKDMFFIVASLCILILPTFLSEDMSTLLSYLLPIPFLAIHTYFLQHYLNKTSKSTCIYLR